MTQAPMRANLNNSRLIRFLTDLSGTPLDASSEQRFAERLAQLFDFSDAVTLSAAQKDCSAGLFDASDASTARVEEEFLRVRSSLMNSIVQSFTPSVGNPRIKLPQIDVNASVDSLSYEPYLRFYAAHQRDMDAGVRTLRGFIRDSMANFSAPLKQLSVLDAAFDEILSDRSRKLFSNVPKLLERRFEQLFNAHQQSLNDAQRTDNSATWSQPGGWMAIFCSEMQGVLLAELEVRLQPVLGLVEAFIQEVNKQQ